VKITLRKITKIPLDFEEKSGKMIFKGYLEYHSGKLILLQAKLSGLLEKSCDICAQDFKMPIDEEVEFFLSDGIYSGSDDIDLDVVESLNGMADIEELLASEIELIKSDYHSCDKCKHSVSRV
jgi:uncharacterized metal-binding protein YceD (DUF177 family)